MSTATTSRSSAGANGTDSTSITPTSITPTAGARFRSLRLPIALVLIVLVLAILGAAASSKGVGTLDTGSYSKTGSHAIAELLRDQGNDVRQVRRLDDAAATSGGTLVVVGPDLLTSDQVGRLNGSGATTIVVIGTASGDIANAFAPGTEVDRTVDAGVLDPACALPAAAVAGRADAGSVAYRNATATGCYPTGGDPSLLDVRTTTRHVVLLGNSAPLENGHLGKEGNAALALNLLGSDGDVTWYLPSLDDLYGVGNHPDEGKSLVDLVPDGVIGGLAWVAVVAVLLALWRARRLGPIVDEPLPVVVRASETDEGRARLYRRGANRDRAAALLRAATRDRLAPLLGLPGAAGRVELVRAVAARTGRTPETVDALLYGAAPHDDARLVQLADELDRLDREVHGP